MSLVLETVQWASLSEIDDVDPINETDREVLEEIRNVLVRHNRTERFGVCLLHKHFEIGENEIGVEYTDVEGRTSTIVVEPRDGSSGSVIETNWRFRKGESQNVTVCVRRCQYNSGHRQVHVKEGR